MVARMEHRQGLGGRSAATMPPHDSEVGVSSGFRLHSAVTVVYNNMSYA